MDNSAAVIASQFIDDVAQGRFEAGAQHFDDKMLAFLPAEKLGTTWQAIEGQLGAFQRRVEAQTESVGNYERVIITCAFAHGNLDATIAINAEKQISGIFLNPLVSRQESAELPAYIQPDTFHETEVEVGQGEWVLPGTLTLPVGVGPFPALVLVHGSGPQDRDETIGPNKPFRDLAWGLASQQIAVLRYEKRTKVYGQQMQQLDSSLTVQEETVDDALEAARLLRSLDQVDAKRIVVLGHSLGGYLMPRIGAADATLAGLIILAGSTRPLEDIIIDQIAYIFSTQETVSDEQQQYLETLKQQAARVKSADLTPETPDSELPFSVSATYWLNLRGYAPAALARQLPQPMLIMQAESDYQVTPADFTGWQQELTGKPRVIFKSYPGLSHLFMPVPAGKMATPLTYAIPGYVDTTVVADIAQWIKGIHI